MPQPTPPRVAHRTTAIAHRSRCSLSIFRYSLVGAIATVVHYALLIVLVVTIHLQPGRAAVWGSLSGAMVAYLGNRRFTFTTHATHLRAAPRFLAVAALGAALNGLIVWAGFSFLELHYLLAQASATCIVLFITYWLNRVWTFA